jgi:acyl-homoserine-lactone acylase
MKFEKEGEITLSKYSLPSETQKTHRIKSSNRVFCLHGQDISMINNFGKVDLTLGDIQKLVRGDDARPADGLPDILAAAYSKPYLNGTRNITTGDAYICLVRYPKIGLPIIESINTFGASQQPNSAHYKDQMLLFQNQQTKHMTLDKNEVLKNAERVYHPMLIK